MNYLHVQREPETGLWPPLAQKYLILGGCVLAGIFSVQCFPIL